ncbi:HU family DNA-binding protein [Candidatus Parcubacteria bacterium]|nr:MAG: HU family DNA-binding protein [Candidatus Parcubacteria bacterium]
MEKRSVGKKEILQHMMLHGGYTRDEAERAFNAFVNSMLSLISHESVGRVYLSGLGAFHIKEVGERVGRNPKTGEKVVVPPRRTIRFRASGKMSSLLEAMPEH